MVKIPTKVCVRSVDHYGYNGREHHPRDTDIGHVLTVHTIEVFHPEPGEDPDSGYTVLTCTREDGSLVEMIDFEVEDADK